MWTDLDNMGMPGGPTVLPFKAEKLRSVTLLVAKAPCGVTQEH